MLNSLRNRRSTPREGICKYTPNPSRNRLAVNRGSRGRLRLCFLRPRRTPDLLAAAPRPPGGATRRWRRALARLACAARRRAAHRVRVLLRCAGRAPPPCWRASRADPGLHARRRASTCRSGRPADTRAGRRTPPGARPERAGSGPLSVTAHLPRFRGCATRREPRDTRFRNGARRGGRCP